VVSVGGHFIHDGWGNRGDGGGGCCGVDCAAIVGSVNVRGVGIDCCLRAGNLVSMPQREQGVRVGGRRNGGSVGWGSRGDGGGSNSGGGGIRGDSCCGVGDHIGDSSGRVGLFQRFIEVGQVV
jgi:hypothetical protein